MTIISTLHIEHINLGRLLRLLDAELARLRAGEHLDYMLLCDVIGYISEHAEKHHHPREDIMFDYFQGRQEGLDTLMNACREEHGDLKGCGRKLLDIIDGILHDAVVPASEMEQKLDAFVHHEKAHLDYEEARVFPAIREIATDEDWARLDAQFPDIDDPVFGKRTADEYRYLIEALKEDLDAP